MLDNDNLCLGMKDLFPWKGALGTNIHKTTSVSVLNPEMSSDILVSKIIIWDGTCKQTKTKYLIVNMDFIVKK